MSILILDKVEVPPDAPDGLWVIIRKMVDPFASLRSMEGVAVIDGADRKRSREAGIRNVGDKTQCGVRGKRESATRVSYESV